MGESKQFSGLFSAKVGKHHFHNFLTDQDDHDDYIYDHYDQDDNGDYQDYHHDYGHGDIDFLSFE